MNVKRLNVTLIPITTQLEPIGEQGVKLVVPQGITCATHSPGYEKILLRNLLKGAAIYW